MAKVQLKDTTPDGAEAAIQVRAVAVHDERHVGGGRGDREVVHEAGQELLCASEGWLTDAS